MCQSHLQRICCSPAGQNHGPTGNPEEPFFCSGDFVDVNALQIRVCGPTSHAIGAIGYGIRGPDRGSVVERFLFVLKLVFSNLYWWRFFAETHIRVVRPDQVSIIDYTGSPAQDADEPGGQHRRRRSLLA